MTLRVLVWVVLSMAACKDDVPKCVPGATMMCPCSGGDTGIQTCDSDGTFGTCVLQGGMCIRNTNPSDGGAGEDAAVGGPDAAKSGPRYVFITSLTYDGSFGGLAGADSICSTLAASAGKAGAWKAWLSDESTNALDRIDEVGPWYAMGTTTLVAATKGAFAYTPASSIAIDQNGQGTSNLHGIWTGTKVGGTRATGETCQSWTANANTSTGTFVQEYGVGTAGWTSFGGFPCNASYHLACVEQ